MIELSIVAKDSETKFIDSEVCYDPITLSRDDPKLGRLVEQTRLKFMSAKGCPPEEIDICVKAKMIW